MCIDILLYKYDRSFIKIFANILADLKIRKSQLITIFSSRIIIPLKLISLKIECTQLNILFAVYRNLAESVSFCVRKIDFPALVR